MGPITQSAPPKLPQTLARRMESELRIVVAYDPIPPFLGEPNMQEAINARLGDAQAILNKAESGVGEVPGGVHGEMLEGSSAEAIIEVANDPQERPDRHGLARPGETGWFGAGEHEPEGGQSRPLPGAHRALTLTPTSRSTPLGAPRLGEGDSLRFGKFLGGVHIPKCQSVWVEGI
jgi:hypothetical protein